MYKVITVRDSQDKLHIFMENTKTGFLRWTYPTGDFTGYNQDVVGSDPVEHSYGNVILRTLDALLSTHPKYVSFETVSFN